jgi:hypothetical protein
MKKYLFALFLIANISHAQRAKVDYGQCIQKQQLVIQKLKSFHEQKANDLIHRASKIDLYDQEANEVQGVLIKLANESYLKSLIYNSMIEKFQENGNLSESLSDFTAKYENVLNTKLIMRIATNKFKSWTLNSKVPLSIKRAQSNLKVKILEEVLMGFSGELLNGLTEEEMFLLGLGSQIGIKAGIDITSRLITTRAIGSITGATLLEWAGGTVGAIVAISPLFLSGTLPLETKWLDMIQLHPELLIYPQRMVEAGLAKSEEHALFQHCLTWQRREKGMMNMLEKLLENHNKKIEKIINRVHLNHQGQRFLQRYKTNAADNTYYKINILQKP